MPLWFNKKLNLTEAEIRHVMPIGISMANMAKLIGCNRVTFAMYANSYIDEETGKTLNQLCIERGKENRKAQLRKMKMEKSRFVKTSMTSILTGKHPKFSRKVLKERLISEGVFEEKCALCGFEERRVLDYKVPLILVFKDSNKENHMKDNMEFCCYNCFFLNYNDLKIKADNYTLNHLYRIS